MIITCERCATRFKVPDDKLAAGAVRMRCSKCNHVFLAGPGAEVAGAATLPPAAASTVPPAFAAPTLGAPRVPSVPAPVSGAVPVFGAPRAASSDPFANLGRPDPFAAAPPGSAPTPFAPPGQPASFGPPSSTSMMFGAPMPPAVPSPPSPSFGAPTQTSAMFGAAVPPAMSAPPRPLSPDPFAGLGAASSSMPPQPQPRPSLPDPFANLGAPAKPASKTNDPFAGLGQPLRPQTPVAMNDPFAGLPLGASSPPAPLPLVPRPPSRDPFAGIGLAAPQTASPPPFGAAGPDPFAALSSSPSPPPSSMPPVPAPTSPDPFSPPAGLDPFAAAPRAVDPFAAAPDPFAAAMSSPPQHVDPFAAATSTPPRAGYDDDPFAAPHVPTTQPPIPSPASDDEDPFGRLDDVTAPPRNAQPFDDSARAALFGVSAPTPPTSTSSAFGGPPQPFNAPSGLELAAPRPQEVSGPIASATSSRALPVLRVALAVLQVVLFIAMVAGAVVVARGGLPDQAASTTTYRVGDVGVARRTTTSGLPLLVVTGIVHHGGDQPLGELLVDVVVDGRVIGTGHAWSDVDGFTIASLGTADDVKALQQTKPRAPRVAPGDDASFVVVAVASGLDPGADIDVVARAP